MADQPINTNCFQAPKGTSKGNIANARILVKYIKIVLESIPEIDLSRYVYPIVPYLEKYNVCIKIKATDLFWVGLHVVTANKVQGHEKI